MGIRTSVHFWKCPYCDFSVLIRNPHLRNHIVKEHPDKIDEWDSKLLSGGTCSMCGKELKRTIYNPPMQKVDTNNNTYFVLERFHCSNCDITSEKTVRNVFP